jgi:hypothetical protein
MAGPAMQSYPLLPKRIINFVAPFFMFIQGSIFAPDAHIH